ncbi:MAG: hypothetical protein Crog4KO_20780 [Crocinitomicaceae bacterium]
MIRIVFTGPESTGKSTLAMAAADALKGDYVKEYARTFLEEYGPNYEVEDLDTMALGHANAMDETPTQLQLVDADFVVFKIWSEHKYGAASPLIYSLISENRFDLHVLCAPDIPWEEDPLRESPNDRDALFQRYVEELERFHKPYIIVEGAHDKRLKKVLTEVRELSRNL